MIAAGPSAAARLELADRVHRAVAAIPGVAAVRASRSEPVATLGPGRAVAGVRVTAATVTVTVAADLPGPQGARSLPELAIEIRRVVRATPGVGRRPVDVLIVDVVEPDLGDSAGQDRSHRPRSAARATDEGAPRTSDAGDDVDAHENVDVDIDLTAAAMAGTMRASDV